MFMGPRELRIPKLDDADGTRPSKERNTASSTNGMAPGCGYGPVSRTDSRGEARLAGRPFAQREAGFVPSTQEMNPLVAWLASKQRR